MPFAPDDPDGPRPIDVEKTLLSLHDPEWQRWFIAEDRQTGDVIGHVNLQQKRLRAALHRCEVGVGLEEFARGQGVGKSLMQTAIGFAREQASIDWIDLRVFAHNVNARILYKRLGFREIGVLYDWVRIEGQSIDDIVMVLDVR